MCQLIRVRNVDTPDALMLSPTQAYFLRENLKLRLLNARMALLSRNEGAFRRPDRGAGSAGKYFDTRARSTQTVQALRQSRAATSRSRCRPVRQPERCAQLQSEAIVCVYSSG
jgi:uncharacterized protein HemX